MREDDGRVEAICLTQRYSRIQECNTGSIIVGVEIRCYGMVGLESKGCDVNNTERNAMWTWVMRIGEDTT